MQKIPVLPFQPEYGERTHHPSIPILKLNTPILTGAKSANHRPQPKRYPLSALMFADQYRVDYGELQDLGHLQNQTHSPHNC